MNPVALERLLAWMEDHAFPSFFLSRPENFAWLTGGANNTVIINEGVAWLEIRKGKIVLHTSRIEAQRLKDEETTDISDIVVYPWHQIPRLPSPNDYEYDLTPLRILLSPKEQDVFRELGKDIAKALTKVIQNAKPSWTERELAGALAEELYARGVIPLVLLVAGEERIFKYRHPLPKDRRLGQLFMAVVCGCRQGLVANLTRMRTWGHPEAQELYKKVLAVEAAALNATQPGEPIRQVLLEIQEAYRRVGFPQAFEEHHQGGIAGYRPREIVATPDNPMRLEVGMAVAWNPSLPGAKVEDTFLVTEKGLENLTVDPDWPMVEVEGRLRPALLEL